MKDMKWVCTIFTKAATDVAEVYTVEFPKGIESNSVYEEPAFIRFLDDQIYAYNRDFKLLSSVKTLGKASTRIHVAVIKSFSDEIIIKDGDDIFRNEF